MIRFLILLFVLNAGLAFGQSFSYPAIVPYGHKIIEFIPSNWTLLDSTTGDLNRDQRSDLAFVIQYRDSVSMVKTDNSYSDTVITQPRILLITFYDTVKKQYKLIEQSNSFILNHDNPNMEEPFQHISISKGVLKIDFQIFMNMGGWEMSDNTYLFRYQDNEFVLIGADYNSTNRASGETENRSYNFLTKKVRTSKGNISTKKQKTEWRTFQPDKLKTLNTFTQPFTWEIENDYYL
jgi:hypothetical protein